MAIRRNCSEASYCNTLKPHVNHQLVHLFLVEWFTTFLAGDLFSVVPLSMTCGQFNQSYFLFFFIWNDFRGLRRSIYPVFHNKWGKIGEKTEKLFIIFLEKVCFSYFLSCDPSYFSCDPLRDLDRWLWWGQGTAIHDDDDDFFLLLQNTLYIDQGTK